MGRWDRPTGRETKRLPVDRRFQFDDRSDRLERLEHLEASHIRISPTATAASQFAAFSQFREQVVDEGVDAVVGEIAAGGLGV